MSSSKKKTRTDHRSRRRRLTQDQVASQSFWDNRSPVTYIDPQSIDLDALEASVLTAKLQRSKNFIWVPR